MFDAIAFLFTGRLATGITIPFRMRWAVVRGRVAEEPQYDYGEGVDDWTQDYWWQRQGQWPEDPGELEQAWKDREDGCG